jgi:hypothetical protein
VGEASIGADEVADLLLASKRQAVCIEGTDVGVSHTPNPDLVDEELFAAPLSSLLEV